MSEPHNQSEVKPSVIEQLSTIYDTLDGLVSYCDDVGCKKDSEFYRSLATLIHLKLQELKQ